MQENNFTLPIDKNENGGEEIYLTHAIKSFYSNKLISFYL